MHVLKKFFYWVSRDLGSREPFGPCEPNEPSLHDTLLVSEYEKRIVGKRINSFSKRSNSFLKTSKCLLRFTPKSRMGKALVYTYTLLPRLSRYVLDGRYHIDNNGVENAIRPLAIGRKNYLFCGNHDAAVRAAIVYSLFSSCKAHDIDVRTWLVDILKRIPTEKALTNYCRVTGRYYPLIAGNSRYYQLLAATTRYYLGNGG